MSHNVFADLGASDAETRLTKARIVRALLQISREKGLTQTQVAELFGLTQPKVSDLFRGNFHGYSIDRLLRFVNIMKRDVRIVIASQDSESDAHTTVIAA